MITPLLQLALAPPKPVKLITADPPAPLVWPEWLTWTLLGGVAAATITWLIVRAFQRLQDRAAEEIAFRRLTRQAGSSDDRALLQAVAGATGQSPLALWLSDHALSLAVESFARTGPDAATLARVGILCDRRGIPRSLSAPAPRPGKSANTPVRRRP